LASQEILITTYRTQIAARDECQWRPGSACLQEDE
jgi:hypothetical protein